ncbi:hypothetical protein PUN28_002331 [Cardiocondyla obscurior]|uniref:Uncharacterized protein n=1 Tax=Cardiocondyla obscurior TaxID=286306 RepID=A0AAW2GTJ0_9HYME
MRNAPAWGYLAERRRPRRFDDTANNLCSSSQRVRCSLRRNGRIPTINEQLTCPLHRLSPNCYPNGTKKIHGKSKTICSLSSSSIFLHRKLP